MGEYRFNPKACSKKEPEFEFDPSEPTPERKKIKPELTIIVPEGFKLSEHNLHDALEAIVTQHRRGNSVQELRERELDYSGNKVYPTPIFIRAKEILGAEKPNGWAGLVVGVGPNDQYAKPQALEAVLTHAQKIIQMDQSDRNAVLSGIDLVAHGRDFFVDSDGRHRMLTLKALDELGCDVTISGVKVTKMV